MSFTGVLKFSWILTRQRPRGDQLEGATYEGPIQDCHGGEIGLLQAIGRREGDNDPPRERPGLSAEY